MCFGCHHMKCCWFSTLALTFLLHKLLFVSGTPLTLPVQSVSDVTFMWKGWLCNKAFSFLCRERSCPAQTRAAADSQSRFDTTVRHFIIRPVYNYTVIGWIWWKHATLQQIQNQQISELLFCRDFDTISSLKTLILINLINSFKFTSQIKMLYLIILIGYYLLEQY